MQAPLLKGHRLRQGNGGRSSRHRRKRVQEVKPTSLTLVQVPPTTCSKWHFCSHRVLRNATRPRSCSEDPHWEPHLTSVQASCPLHQPSAPSTPLAGANNGSSLHGSGKTGERRGAYMERQRDLQASQASFLAVGVAVVPSCVGRRAPTLISTTTAVGSGVAQASAAYTGLPAGSGGLQAEGIGVRRTHRKE